MTNFMKYTESKVRNFFANYFSSVKTRRIPFINDLSHLHIRKRARVFPLESNEHLFLFF